MRDTMRSGHPAFAAALLTVSLLTACGSESSHSSCGYYASVAPAEVAVEAVAHPAGTRDTLWPQRLTSEMSAFRADSTVFALFSHASALVESDRGWVRDRGGTIVVELPADYALAATFSVAQLRALAAAATTERVIDAHLVTPNVLPACR